MSSAAPRFFRGETSKAHERRGREIKTMSTPMDSEAPLSSLEKVSLNHTQTSLLCIHLAPRTVRSPPIDHPVLRLCSIGQSRCRAGARGRRRRRSPSRSFQYAGNRFRIPALSGNRRVRQGLRVHPEALRGLGNPREGRPAYGRPGNPGITAATATGRGYRSPQRERSGTRSARNSTARTPNTTLRT